MESDADILAAWCSLLPVLRERARVESVLDRLERDVARVGAGASARTALRKWQPEEEGEAKRGWSDRPTVAMPQLPSWGGEPGVGAGAYVCPRNRCNRRSSRDQAGHPPQCAAFGTPMTPA